MHCNANIFFVFFYQYLILELKYCQLAFLAVWLSLTLTQGKQGEIRHVYRHFVYIHSRDVVDNGGIFVCKARHLELAGGSHSVSEHNC